MHCFVALVLLIQAAPRPQVVSSTGGVVVSAAPAATEIGVRVLQDGGNAVDAAVAVGFGLAVAWPEAGNIGGGGFMLVYPGDDREPAFFDYRETAPLAATPTMFAKKVDYASIRTCGVPGSVRGLALAHKRFGKLSWSRLVTPAAELAANGVPVTPGFAERLNEVIGDPKVTNAEFRRVYTRPGGGPWRAGDKLLQPDLARTLALIAKNGADAFYTGELADKLDAEMTARAGLVTKQDLAAYQAKERAPLMGTYRDTEVWCAPPPSSGGITLLIALNLLEKLPGFGTAPRQSADTLHALAEASRRAYRERAAYLGDPDFVKIPPNLTSKAFAATLAPIDPAKATPSRSIAGDIAIATRPESPQTTHYSIIDAKGMAVSTTTTLENSWGCRVVVRGAGYLLNNEMTDFNHRPGVTEESGRIGTPANVIQGGKRMLSSMCPVILTRGGKVIAVTGSPGGRTIINTVLCVIVNLIDYKMTAAEAVDAPRQHHQWFPDRLTLEGKPDAAVVESLRKRGHTVTFNPRQGDAHTITVNPTTGVRTGAADLRLDGAAGATK